MPPKSDWVKVDACFRTIHFACVVEGGVKVDPNTQTLVCGGALKTYWDLAGLSSINKQGQRIKSGRRRTHCVEHASITLGCLWFLHLFMFYVGGIVIDNPLSQAHCMGV